ncbi:MAG TPA: hypothetical protein VJV78_46390 [Polyangiales bacterium]|nr:hypothetical protein [Polyangiales bacterium]
MPSLTKIISAAVLFACLGSSGCDKEKPPKYATPRHRDAEVDFDAGPDGSSVEPGADGSTSDGSVDPETDAAVSGSGGKGGKGGTGGSGGSAGSSGRGGSGGSAGASGKSGQEPAPCTVSDEDNSYTTATTTTDDSRVSMAIGKTGFGVAYAAPNCKIQVLPVLSSGLFNSPIDALEDCATTIRELSLLHVTDGWRLVWIDNNAGSAELQTMLLRDDMSERVGELRARLTTNTLREQRHVLANVGGSPLLAFIAMDPVSSKQRISTLVLDGQASPQDVVTEASGHKPSNLALTQIGANEAALAWVEEDGHPGVWLQRTNLQGVAQGDPIQLSDVLSAGSVVDLAARDIGEGGAVLYSLNVGGLNQEVRIRRLDETGQLLADERKIVGAPLQARDGSFARLGGGYVVAYRAMPGGPITSPEIRVTFISKEGTLQHDPQGGLLSYKLADASGAGGRVTVRVSTDGELLVSYVDATPNGEQLKLIRKRLDCAL